MKINNYKTALLSVMLGGSMLVFFGCEQEMRGLPAEVAAETVVEDLEEGDEVPPSEEAPVRELYTAELEALNSQAAGEVSGIATFIVENGKFVATVDMDNVPADIVHPQHVHVLDACPTMEDDANEDGFVDIQEASAVIGAVLLPLDSELADSEAGDFPVGDASGNYFYGQSAQYEDVLEAFGEGGELNLDNRVIAIHGVSEEAQLPETVSAGEGNSPHENLPIACGVISRVTANGDDPDGDDPDGDDPDGDDPDGDDPEEDDPEEDDGQKPEQQQRQKV